MKKSKNLRSEIDELDKELEKLTERRKDVEEKLSELTEGLASSDGDNGYTDEIRSLKTDKDVLEEVIHRKQEEKAELEKNLNSVIGKETEEEQFQKLISLAEKSAEAQAEYYKAAKIVDDIIKERMLKYMEIREKWYEINTQFINLADEVAKGFKSGTWIRYVRNGRQEELKSDDLIEKLEAEGVTLDPLFDGEIMESQYHNYVRKVDDVPDIIFSDFIYHLSASEKINQLLAEKE